MEESTSRLEMDRTRGMADRWWLIKETVSVETLNMRGKAGTPPGRCTLHAWRWKHVDRSCTRQREVVNERGSLRPTKTKDDNDNNDDDNNDETMMEKQKEQEDDRRMIMKLESSLIDVYHRFGDYLNTSRKFSFLTLSMHLVLRKIPITRNFRRSEPPSNTSHNSHKFKDCDSCDEYFTPSAVHIQYKHPQ